MTAAAATADAGGSGASAPAAASVPAYDAWGVDARGETEPRGSHAIVEAALRAGVVVTHGRAVEAVRQGTPSSAVDRIVRDALGIDLHALRGLITSANSLAAIASVCADHRADLRRLGADTRTELWVAAVGRAQECGAHGDVAARLRAMVDARLTAPEA